jgi:hypothetical protein
MASTLASVLFASPSGKTTRSGCPSAWDIGAPCSGATMLSLIKSVRLAPRQNPGTSSVAMPAPMSTA